MKTLKSLSNLRGKSVLITGGLGFIGSNLAHSCLQLGARVTIYDCLDPHSGGNIYNLDGIKNDVEMFYGDILNFDELAKRVGDKDILFNCAASTSHPFSMREPWIDLDVNCRGVINLLEATRRFNRDMRFIHLGTSTQLGKLHKKPADELHPEFPTDIYSANKCVSEKYVLIYGQAYQMPVTVVRLPNVFGPRATIHSPEFNFMNYFIGLALQNKAITVYGEGSQLRNVLYVDDCVNALIKAAQNQRVVGEVLFAAGDEHFSVRQIADNIVKYLGVGKVRTVHWPGERKATEIGDAIISNKKIKKLLGWKPKYQMSVGLQKVGRFYSDKMEHYFGA